MINFSINFCRSVFRKIRLAIGMNARGAVSTVKMECYMERGLNSTLQHIEENEKLKPEASLVSIFSVYLLGSSGSEAAMSKFNRK